MTPLIKTLVISAIPCIVFLIFQFYYFFDTKKYRILFKDFFKRRDNYSTYLKEVNGELITHLSNVGEKNSDLSKLIGEINHYVEKTKGTTDFSVIQNKVERMLNMRYDQSTACLAFPTYIGLMGTFVGVFMGISLFLYKFDGVAGMTDESIQNLLAGVLVSMFTSLCGLLLTTINNAYAGGARKKIEEDKNEFYDFVQTELMPSLDVSMVLAITKLHQTVNQFEPAFGRVINNFQTTFDRCTSAFGENFENNVKAVANAVYTMGENMDKINKNIELQERLLETFKSDYVAKGMEKYIEAANHFVSITQSLDTFEKARRMMLAATQEAINIQNQYSDSLRIPMEVALRVNQILDRIKDFEDSINNLKPTLERREILGEDVVKKLEEQLKGISRKGKIADKYLEIADGRLEDLFKQQTTAIDIMSTRYKNAIEKHIESFETMLQRQTSEVELRHKEFLQAIEHHLSIDEVHQDFSNLRRLNEILSELKSLSLGSVKSGELDKSLKIVQEELFALSKTMKKVEQKTSARRSIFGLGG